jgi:hypothetical protein
MVLDLTLLLILVVFLLHVVVVATNDEMGPVGGGTSLRHRRTTELTVSGDPFGESIDQSPTAPRPRRAA